MNLAYYRVSSRDQSIAAQRHAMGGRFDKEFSDEGVSGGVMAADRVGFADLLKHVRAGDTVHVYAVDRLGRDALDVQSTVRRLVGSGVTVDVRGIGAIGKGVGEIVLAVLAQIADLERERILSRTSDGRAKAREALKSTGRTHKGKASLGRPPAADAAEVASWRKRTGSSISTTAERFGLSVATVKRYCSPKAAG
jgi:putative DNA-invertase from lambdoid prophage Rac